MEQAREERDRGRESKRIHRKITMKIIIVHLLSLLKCKLKELSHGFRICAPLYVIFSIQNGSNHYCSAPSGMFICAVRACACLSVITKCYVNVFIALV